MPPLPWSHLLIAQPNLAHSASKSYFKVGTTNPTLALIPTGKVENLTFSCVETQQWQQ